jgi:hypothetical protein
MVSLPRQEVRDFEDPEYHMFGLERIKSYFEHGAQPVRGIKRPDYLARPEVPARLKADLGDVKLIALLRDPVKRFISAYYYYIKMGFIAVEDINIALNRVRQGGELRGVRSSELFEYGKYGEQLERYLSIHERENMLVIIQERLFLSPQEVFSAIFRFIGISDSGGVNVGRRWNAGVYSLVRLRLIRKRNIFLYRYNKSNKIEERSSRALRLVAALITALDKFILFRIFGNRPPVVTDENLKFLKSIYREDRERIVSLYPDLDLSNWL